MAGDFDLSDEDYHETQVKRCPRCQEPEHKSPEDCPARDPQPARLGRSAI